MTAKLINDVSNLDPGDATTVVLYAKEYGENMLFFPPLKHIKYQGK